MENKYVYGAAIQGIQSFIFQTDKLREIIGASEIVEHVGELFENDFSKGAERIVNAAGNIKYIFSNKEDCAQAVKFFPKCVLNMAPGITISQAVVSMSEAMSFEDAMSQLDRLLKTQRNKPTRPLTYGFMGFERSRQTGLPVYDLKDHTDLGTYKKIESSDKANSELVTKAIGAVLPKSFECPTNFNALTGKNNWIAVLHADGNSLGKVVMAIGGRVDVFSEFSKKLEEATQNATRLACKAIFDTHQETFSKGVFPFRPIILGGDDLTIICRGDLAITFAREFLVQFEAQTHRLLGSLISKAGLHMDRLTACVGISFIKGSYPFYYGYRLAEDLCTRAKKISGVLAQGGVQESCLMFHKVQDSYIDTFDNIEKRSAIAENFGPYFIGENPKKEGFHTIDQLNQSIRFLTEYPSLKSNLREWITALYEDEEQANQKLNRMKDIYKSIWGKQADAFTSGVLRVVPSQGFRYPVFDAISLYSILSNTTN